jgi:hypothetical protein
MDGTSLAQRRAHMPAWTEELEKLTLNCTQPNELFMHNTTTRNEQ